MADDTRELQLVTFLLAGVRYALDIAHVQEIVRLPPMTHVPRAPAHVAGMSNLRGRVLPIIDARRRMGLPTRDTDDASRVVVIARREGAVGLVVDAVAEILRLPAHSVIQGAALDAAWDSQWVEGVGKWEDRLILLLDLDKLLDDGLSTENEPPSSTLPLEPEDEIPASAHPTRPRLRLAA